MCGIAGQISFHDRYRISRDLLTRMGDAIAHRGPDARANWINHENQIHSDHPQCAFTFARLAILDLDPRAMQPMTDGRRHIVFNGEIFNFRELRAELDSLRPSHPWKTTGDTEVILRAYDAWGESCVEHLIGQFAFAIWDPDPRTVFFARDRMGEKPLYLAIAPDHQAVAFASELAALRVLSWPDWQTNPPAVAQYLQTGYIPSPATIYRGAIKLPPASSMLFKAGQAPQIRSYFDPNKSAAGEVTSQTVKSAVTAAVRRQLVSDVPLGCFLSGGIDSSVIAATMKAAVPKDQPVLTFSIGFDDPRYDETPYAAEVAKHLGTQHRQFTVRPDAAADLPRLAAVYGEPFGDSSALPTHYLSRETRRHVTVALSGDGGDELFGGYDRYRAMRLGQSARRIPAFVRSAAAALPGSHPKSRLSRLKRFAATLDLPPARRYASYVALFDPDTIKNLYPSAAGEDFVRSIYESLSPGRDPVQAALATDRRTYLPEDLLTKVDRASMLHALEVRAPFMDPDLVSLAAGLKTDQLLRGGSKRLLREAFSPDLPKSVFSRPKMGFAVPIGDWLRTSLRPMLHDLLTAKNSFASAHFNPQALTKLLDDHHSHHTDHSQRLYALLMLELWHRQ